mmetsp:Transcript_109084/g.171945  ORF Transcript_109084/g.171945 Transcript_109084/m.171945 type:complete len:328 (-) Transcript_109084:97-1080(-)
MLKVFGRAGRRAPDGAHGGCTGACTAACARPSGDGALSMPVGREPGRVGLDADGTDGETDLALQRRGFADVVCGRGGGAGTKEIGSSDCASVAVTVRPPAMRRRAGLQADVDDPTGRDGTSAAAGFLAASCSSRIAASSAPLSSAAIRPLRTCSHICSNFKSSYAFFNLPSSAAFTSVACILQRTFSSCSRRSCSSRSRLISSIAASNRPSMTACARTSRASALALNPTSAVLLLAETSWAACNGAAGKSCLEYKACKAATASALHIRSFASGAMGGIGVNEASACCVMRHSQASPAGVMDLATAVEGGKQSQGKGSSGTGAAVSRG